MVWDNFVALNVGNKVASGTFLWILLSSGDIKLFLKKKTFDKKAGKRLKKNQKFLCNYKVKYLLKYAVFWEICKRDFFRTCYGQYNHNIPRQPSELIFLVKIELEVRDVTPTKGKDRPEGAVLKIRSSQTMTNYQEWCLYFESTCFEHRQRSSIHRLAKCWCGPRWRFLSAKEDGAVCGSWAVLCGPAFKRGLKKAHGLTCMVPQIWGKMAILPLTIVWGA